MAISGDYILLFPNVTAIDKTRMTYSEAVSIVEQCVGGDEYREEAIRREFEIAWMNKFRTITPVDSDTVLTASFLELMRELILNRFESIDGLQIQTANSKYITCCFHADQSLLLQHAQESHLRLAVWPQVDPGTDEIEDILDRESAEKELYRMFLASQIHPSEAKIYPDETPELWSRRIRVLQRLPKTDDSKQQQLFHFTFLNQPKVQYLYQHLFRPVDRIRITKRLLESEFDCDKLVQFGILAGHFCPHGDQSMLDQEWGSLSAPFKSKQVKWTRILSYQPLQDIRNYFGEEIALYFAYLSFYAENTVWLGLLGLGSVLIRMYDSKKHYDQWLIVSAICFTCFSIAFIEKWCRKESFYAFQWGVDHVEHVSAIRPGYKGKLRISPIDNRLEPHAPSFQQAFRKLFVSIGVFLTICGSILSSVSLLYLQHYLEVHVKLYGGKLLCQVLMAGLVPISCSICHQIALWLNDFENHRTDLDFDSSLTFKCTYVGPLGEFQLTNTDTVFQTFNYYTSLTLVAFVKPLTTDCTVSQLDTTTPCSAEARQLLLLTLVVLLKMNLMELVVPWLRKLYQTHDILNMLVRPEDHDSEIETQVEMELYPGVLSDYAQIIMMFGYVSCFGVLEPSIAFFAYLYAVLQVRIDAYKLCFSTRRPFPTPRANIGYWVLYLYTLAILSVFSNAALLLMVISQKSKIKPDIDALYLYTRLVLILMVLSCAVRYILMKATPDASWKRLAKRQEWLEDQYLHGSSSMSLSKLKLSTGRVYLNGLYRYIVTGCSTTEDRVEDLYERRNELQRRVGDLQIGLSNLQRRYGNGLGNVTIVLKRTTELPKAMDYYVKVKIQGKQLVFRSQVKKKCKTPVWNKTFEIKELESFDTILSFTLMDWERVGKDRKIATASTRIGNTLRSLVLDNIFLIDITAFDLSKVGQAAVEIEKVHAEIETIQHELKEFTCYRTST